MNSRWSQIPRAGAILMTFLCPATLAFAQAAPAGVRTGRIVSCEGNRGDAVLSSAVCVQTSPGGKDPCFANLLKNVVVQEDDGSSVKLDFLALEADETGDSLMALMMVFIPDAAKRQELRTSYFISSIDVSPLEFVSAPSEAVLHSRAPGQTIAVGRLKLTINYDVEAMVKAGVPAGQIQPRGEMLLGNGVDLSKVLSR